MSLNHYIEKQIIDKNRSIYLKHYRWVLHIFWMLMFTFIGITESIDDNKDATLSKLLLALLPLAPFYLFFYYYCLYLLPYCFKLQRHKRFWSQLVLLLIVFPAIYYGIQWNLKSVFPPLAKDFRDSSPAMNLLHAYVSFLSSFVGFTAMLYFFELLEEIRTVKETAKHREEYSLAALNKIKTQINPAFMSASLDGIIHLAETHNEKAAEAVVHFADVLRYRLYKSKHSFVPVAQEVTQLRNLFELQQQLSAPDINCSLEIEGSPPEGRVAPLSLITLAAPLFNLKNMQEHASLLMYLLMEEAEIQVAIELNIPPSLFMDEQFEKIRQDLEQLTYEGINFTLEKDSDNYSLRTCIPIYKNSTAS